MYMEQMIYSIGKLFICIDIFDYFAIFKKIWYFGLDGANDRLNR